MLYTRILTAKERERVRNYLLAGERSGPIRQLVARSKRYLLPIEDDLELIKALRDSDASRKPKVELGAKAESVSEIPETAGKFAEYCSECGNGILDEENYCANCGAIRGTILEQLEKVRVLQL
jgi:hypothetical protein